MTGVARAVEWKNLDPELQKFASSTQTFITPGCSYDIHALSVYLRTVFCLVVDDLGAPAFIPACFFQVDSCVVPQDWVLNLMPEIGVDFVIGPEFIARNAETYNAMVDHDAEQVTALWQRIRTIRRNEEGPGQR